MSRGNGNYLGQEFWGVQGCPKCLGKGFLNPDGTPVNAFEGCDSDPTIDCPDCQPEPRSDLRSNTYLGGGV